MKQLRQCLLRVLSYGCRRVLRAEAAARRRITAVARTRTRATDGKRHAAVDPRGAVVGEVVADDAGAGAAAGVVSGRSQSRRQTAAASQQASQQQQAAVQEKQAAFNKARAACLEGKGYTVK